MNELFTLSLLQTAEALGQIFFISLIAGILVRKGIFPDEYLKPLSYLTVNILLPSLIFANTLETFNPEEQVGWWILPLAGFALSAGGLLIAYLFFIRSFKENKDVLPVAALQNAGYLILPVGQLLYPERFKEFSVYVFLFIIGFNVVLWSIGKYLLSDADKGKIQVKALLTVPLIANVSSVVLVLSGLQVYIPEFIVSPVGFVGSATVPVATFILGATLGSISVKAFPKWHIVLRVLFIKLILLAGITVFILYFSELKISNPLMCKLLVLEASAAPAANLIVMIRNYGGNRQKVGSLMLVSYTLSLFTMPLWIAFWDVLQT